MNNAQEEPISYREFEAEANRRPDESSNPVRFGGFEWPEQIGTGMRMPSCTIAELAERPSCPLRIVFAPLDLPNTRTVEDLLALYKLYSIPGAFVSERLHHVACSFGSSHEKHGSSYSWFHFLCKNVPVEEVNGVKHIVNRNRRDAKDFRQADFSWVRSAYCLKVKPPSQTRGWSEVTLIAFGGEHLLWEKFEVLSSNTSWQNILEDPYCLFNIAFEVLYARIDRLAWDLTHVYSQEEEKILRSADHSAYATDALDFVGLHILSKHQIYLIEATEAVTATLDSVRAHHERVTVGSTSPSSFIACEMQASFHHRRTLFKSTDLRLKSLEKRIQNMINLSFHLVTQADSRNMRVDSSAMKTIAVMTLVFLPCTAVANIFSTPFFYLSANSDGGPLRTSPYFWLMWVISVPLTMLVMLAWYMHSKKRLEIRVVRGAHSSFV